MTALHVAARELAAMVRSPVAYVVAVAFLVVQGLSFYAVVDVLSDPTRPAPLGAVLEGHFGGGLLHWTLQIGVVSLLAMRTIAEHRRAGTWEVMITAPVGEGAAVTGAWLGALAFYAVLWIPTLAYLAVVAVYAPAGASFDAGPVAAAYLGELLIGASFLAIGVAASAATANQIVAGVIAFASLLALLVVGEVPALRVVSARAHLAAFARGEIELVPIVLHGGVTIAALSLAATLARVGRRRGSDVGARAIATALVALIVALATSLAARHPRSLDVTARRVNTLAPSTRAVLASVDAPIEIAVLRPSMPVFEPVYATVERVAARMARAQPHVRVRRVDPALEPGRGAEVARLAGTAAPMLERSGAVVVARGDRRAVVLLADLADYAPDVLKAPSVARLSAEPALAAAIADVTDERRATVCVTSGHGELPIAARDDGLDVSLAIERLRGAGIRIEDAGALAGGVPGTCDVVAVLGPTTPLPASAARALAEHVAAGGAALIAATSRDALPSTGLDALLGSAGLAIPSALVVEREGALDLPLAFRVDRGYGDHPAVRGFAEWRPTVWQRARPVVITPRPGVTQTPLVSTSPRSFATRDVDDAESLTAPTDTDLLGPLQLAVYARGAGGPVVAVGSAESLSSAAPRAGIGAGDVLLASMLAELAGRGRPELAGADRTPAQVRLVMTKAERNAVFALCVVILPLGFAATGTAAALWRRRRRA